MLWSQYTHFTNKANGLPIYMHMFSLMNLLTNCLNTKAVFECRSDGLQSIRNPLCRYRNGITRTSEELRAFNSSFGNTMDLSRPPQTRLKGSDQSPTSSVTSLISADRSSYRKRTEFLSRPILLHLLLCAAEWS